MNISISDYLSIPVIQVAGRLTDSEGPGVKQLSHALRDVCRRSGGRVVVDVSGVQFLDSHALGVLVYHNTIMEKAGRKIIFLNTNRNETSYMSRLFNYTNLVQIFTVIDKLECLARAS